MAKTLLPLLLATATIAVTLSSVAKAVASRPLVVVFETGPKDSVNKGHVNFFFEQFRNNSDAIGVDLKVVAWGEEYGGWGTKIPKVLGVLNRETDMDRIVVVADARDVILNAKVKNSKADNVGLRIKKAFEKVIRSAKQNIASPGLRSASKPVVISAEAQCCVGALTWSNPGDYFDKSLKRISRACPSGVGECLHRGDVFQANWTSFMRQTANRLGFADVDDIYLNAGLIAGQVRDVKWLYNALQLGPTEDDQAVLSDLMFRRPGRIVLDYRQRLFGNNRWIRGEEKGCVFDWSEDRGVNIHRHYDEASVFLHFSNEFFTCYDRLGAPLGFVPVAGLGKHKVRWEAAAPSE